MKITEKKLEGVSERVDQCGSCSQHELVDSLQSQLEQVTKERDDCKERLENLRDNSSRTINHYTDKTISLKEKLTKAKSQLKEAEKVIKFYGEDWFYMDENNQLCSRKMEDQGKTAREAKKEIEKLRDRKQ